MSSNNSSDKEQESPGLDNYQVDYQENEEEEEQKYQFQSQYSNEQEQEDDQEQNDQQQQGDDQEQDYQEEQVENESENEEQNLLSKRKSEYDYEQKLSKKQKKQSYDEDEQQQQQEEEVENNEIEVDAENYFKQKYSQIGKFHTARAKKDTRGNALGKAEELIMNMEEIYSKDLRALSNNQPALGKLESIDDIQQTLKNNDVSDEFLKLNGMALLEKWMNKLPDGTFPSAVLRKKLLEILLIINPTKEQIMAANIGQLVMQQYKNQNELGQIRNICKRVIDAWTRILTDNIVDYANVEMNEIDLSKKLKNKNRFEQISKQKVIQQEKQENKYVQRPVEKKFVFYRIPQRGDDIEKFENFEQSEKTKQYMKELVNIKKKKI